MKKIFIYFILINSITSFAQNEVIDTSGYQVLRYRISDQTFLIKLDAKNSEAYLRRSYYKSQIGDYKGSVDDLDIYLQLKPNDYQALNSRGFSKERMADYLGAIED